MKRSLALALCPIVFAVTAGAAGSTSHPSFWRYAHPQAKVLVGVEWQRLANAPLVAQIKQQFQKDMGGLKLAGLPQIPELSFLSGVERIFLSSPGEARKVAGKKQNAPFVAAIQGKFDLAQVRQSIARSGSRATAYKGVVLLVPTTGKIEQCVALVSPQVLLFGDRAAVQAALDSHAAAGAPGPEQSRLFARAAELADRNDIWFVGAVSPAALAGDDAQAAGISTQMFADVESFEAGLALQSGLGLQVNLNTKTEEGARTIGNAITGILALFALQGQGDAKAADFLKKVKISSDHSRVSLALHVDQAELEKGMTQWRAKASPAADVTRITLRPKVTGEAPAPFETVAAARPPEPAKPAVIRIFGAEGGTREIPLESRPKQ